MIGLTRARLEDAMTGESLDMIDKVNSIAGAGKGEVDFKDVEFEGFDLHQRFAALLVLD